MALETSNFAESIVNLIQPDVQIEFHAGNDMDNLQDIIDTIEKHCLSTHFDEIPSRPETEEEALPNNNGNGEIIEEVSVDVAILPFIEKLYESGTLQRYIDSRKINEDENKEENNGITSEEMAYLCSFKLEGAVKDSVWKRLFRYIGQIAKNDSLNSLLSLQYYIYKTYSETMARNGRVTFSFFSIRYNYQLALNPNSKSFKKIFLGF